MGVGVESAYPALIQERIDSVGAYFRVVNAGESGGTSAGGVRRIDWLLRQPVAVLVLELGANDGLRGQDITALRANLQAIIERTLDVHPDAQIIIAGMEAPPNLGQKYTSEFRTVFVDVAQQNGVPLIPFILEGVAGIPEFNQSDGIHPTADGQRIMAETVWQVLGPVLQSLEPA
jgi:acyl-CoA thioesterase-1